MKRILLTLAAVLAATLTTAQIPFSIPDVVPSAVPSAIPGGGGVGFAWTTEPSDHSVDETEELAFSVAAKRGGLAVVYTIGANDSGAVDASTGAYTWTPSYAGAGTYTVTFTATAGGRALSKAITVTVADVDRPIEWVWVPGDTSVSENGIMTFTLKATDPDEGAVITYDTTGYCPNDGDSNPQWNTATGAWTWEPVGYDAVDATDTFELVFTATSSDDPGTTITSEWNLTITDVPPTYAYTVYDRFPITAISEEVPGQIDSTGTLLSGAQVILTCVEAGGEYADTLTTDGTGTVTFSGMAHGNYTYSVNVTKSDYKEYSGDVGITDAGPQTSGTTIETLGTHVIGSTIATNTTWAAANSPYRIDRSLTVSETATLTIDPGVTVKFDSTASLRFTSTNDTCLLAKGAVGDSILFIAGKSSTWNGIHITGANQADTTFKYVRISGGYKKFPYRDGNTLADSSGGGFYTNKTVKLNHCTISGNTAYNGGGEYGGTLTNCTISGNTASGYGGGTHSGTLTNCTISGNTAYNGGGTHSGTLTNCTISGNTAGNSVGGINDGTCINCLIFNNTAGNSIGGINGGILTNCTVIGNTAGVKGNINNSTQWVRGSVIWGGGVTFIANANQTTSPHDSLVSNSMIDLGAGVTFTTVPAVGGVNFATPTAGADSLFADSASVRNGGGICGFMLRDNFLIDVGYPTGGAWVDSTSGTRPIGCNFTVPIGDTTDACDGAFIIRKTNADGNQLAYATERGYHATIHAQCRRGSYARKEQGRIS